jgi:hypothetical protein
MSNTFRISGVSVQLRSGAVFDCYTRKWMPAPRREIMDAAQHIVNCDEGEAQFVAALADAHRARLGEFDRGKDFRGKDGWFSEEENKCLVDEIHRALFA